MLPVPVSFKVPMARFGSDAMALGCSWYGPADWHNART